MTSLHANVASSKKRYDDLHEEEAAINGEIFAVGAGVEGRKAQAAQVMAEIKGDQAVVLQLDAEIDTAVYELAALDSTVQLQQGGLVAARQSKANARSIQKNVLEAEKKLPSTKKKLVEFKAKKVKEDSDRLGDEKKLMAEHAALNREFQRESAANNKKALKSIEKQLGSVTAKIGKLNDKKEAALRDLDRLQEEYNRFTGWLTAYKPAEATAGHVQAKAEFDTLEVAFKNAAAVAKAKLNDVVRLRQDKSGWEKKVKANRKKYQSLSTQLTDKKAEERKRKQLNKKLEGINVKKEQIKRERGTYQHITSAITIDTQTISTIESRIQETVNQLQRSRADLATLQAKYGVDSTLYDALWNEYQIKLAELKYVSSKVKTAEQAVSKAAREQLRQRTVLNTAQIKTEFQLEDVMSTKIAEQIAGKYYIKCNHRRQEESSSGPKDIGAFTKAYDDDYSQIGSAVLKDGEKCPNACDAHEIRLDQAARYVEVKAVAIYFNLSIDLFIFIEGTGGRVTHAAGCPIPSEPALKLKSCFTLELHANLHNSDDSQQRRRHPMDGDFVVWRPERKAREVRVSVYDAELRKYHVLRLSIDTTLGCLLQIDSERTEKEKLISKMPKEYVATSLCLFVILNLLRFWLPSRSMHPVSIPSAR